MAINLDYYHNFLTGNLNELFIIIFVASLLWTFGVHFVKLEEDRFLSYLGVASLSVVFYVIYWSFFQVVFNLTGWLAPISVQAILLIFYAPLQIFLNLLFGKIVWKTSWEKSSSVWIVVNILLGLGVLADLMIISTTAAFSGFKYVWNYRIYWR